MQCSREEWGVGGQGWVCRGPRTAKEQGLKVTSAQSRRVSRVGTLEWNCGQGDSELSSLVSVKCGISGLSAGGKCASGCTPGGQVRESFGVLALFSVSFLLQGRSAAEKWKVCGLC